MRTIGILFEDAVKDNAGKRHHLADRMAQAVDRRVGRKPIHAQSFVGAAMNTDAAAELARFFVKRPVFFIAQMALEAGGRQHDTAEFQFIDRAAHFFDRFRRFLQRHQRQPLKARALFQVSVGEPVVPGARHVDGEFTGDHLAEGQPAGAVEHRALDADIFHELQPAIFAHRTERAGHQRDKASPNADDPAAGKSVP